MAGCPFKLNMPTLEATVLNAVTQQEHGIWGLEEELDM